ncbi:kinase-like protein [Rhizophagus irregularis]|nr:kinase-like protein [Rhizophagus irregularis]
MSSTNDEKKKIKENDINLKREALKTSIDCMMVIGNAMDNYFPLLKTVTIMISEIYTIYDNARYNLNICESLMDRVDIAESVIKTLKRQKKNNEENFRKLEYYKSFLRFVDVLKSIKAFIGEVSTIQGYKRFFSANMIRKKFDSLISEFEVAIRELNFTMTVANEEQRIIDQKALERDIAEMTRFLEKIDGNIIDSTNTLNTVIQEVMIIKKQIETSKVEKFKVTNITPNELLDPLYCQSRGRKEPYICKKVYKGQDIACKPANIFDDSNMDVQKIQAQLVILSKLKDSTNILKFYGISKVDGNQVMMFEWAEFGTLRELYVEKDISWHDKVLIALDICRGLTFLHSCDIFHHDIRCNNIMMTTRLEPKIANFKYSRLFDDRTVDIENIKEIFPWLAPEKMMFSEHPVRYTSKCEIFSFGMLLWELSFRKIPYENMSVGQIREHVLKGKREKMNWIPGTPEIKKIHKGFEKIITMAWQDANCRTSLQTIFLKLYKLASQNDKSNDSKNPLPIEPISMSELRENREDHKIYRLPYALINPLEFGFEAHKREDRKTAWETFCAHADLGNITAKYWKGRYLSKGYFVKADLKQACELFKVAADDGIADAQLDYAFSLLSPVSGIAFDLDIFIKYLTKSADGGNVAAQFNLGDMYLHGKLKCNLNKELGIKYLKLAALNGYPDAIKILENLEIDVFNNQFR